MAEAGWVASRLTSYTGVSEVPMVAIEQAEPTHSHINRVRGTP